MRFSVVALTLFGAAASASASSLLARQASPYPDCANPCIAAADLGGCQATDIHCLCTNQAFVASTTTCIQKSCTGADLTKAQTVATSLCTTVGITLSSAPAGSSTAAGGSSSSTSPATTTGGTGTTGSGTATSAGSSPAATTSKSAATSTGANTFLGLAAAALAALAL